MPLTVDYTAVAQHTGVGQANQGEKVPIRATRDGIPFMHTWKDALLLEGCCFTAPFAAMGATDIVALTGGLDLDQPDFGISVPNGVALIPLKISIAAQFDGDAGADDGFIIIMADIDAAYADDGTVVAVTPEPCIRGSGLTSQATVFENASVNITAPTATKICLDVTQAQIGVSGPCELKIDYEPEIPFIINGPAAIYGWVGGTTDAPTWVGTAMWAEVPESRYKIT